jgi:hypothetical protein
MIHYENLTRQVNFKARIVASNNLITGRSNSVFFTVEQRSPLFVTELRRVF